MGAREICNAQHTGRARNPGAILRLNHRPSDVLRVRRGVVFYAVFQLLLLLTVVGVHDPDGFVKFFGPFSDASLTDL